MLHKAIEDLTDMRQMGFLKAVIDYWLLRCGSDHM